MKKSISNRLCLSLILSVCIHDAFAADNLWDIYLKALDNDPQYKQQAFTHEANKETITQAKGALKPQVNLSAGAGRIHDDIDSAIANGEKTYTNKNAALALTQTLWNKAQFETVKLAEQQVEQSNLLLSQAQQGLLLRTSNAYFNLLAAQDSLGVAEREVAVLKEQFNRSQELLDAGLGTSTDFFQSQSRYELAKVNVLSTQNDIIDTHQALEEIIGQPFSELATLSDSAPIDLPDPDQLDAWLNLAQTQNHELATQRKAAEVAFKNVDISRSGHWPTLGLNLDQNYNDNDDGVNGSSNSRQRRLLLQLSAPIYQGGQVKSQTRQAAHLYTAALQSVDATSRSIARQTRNAYNNVLTSINQVSALKKAVNASKKTLQARQQGFENGLSTNLEILDATRDLFSSQQDFLQARYNYINNLFQLKSLAGTLSAEDFKQTSDWLDK